MHMYLTGIIFGVGDVDVITADPDHRVYISAIDNTLTPPFSFSLPGGFGLIMPCCMRANKA